MGSEQFGPIEFTVEAESDLFGEGVLREERLTEDPGREKIRQLIEDREESKPTSRSTKKERELAELHERLAPKLALVGLALGTKKPVTGYVVADRSSDFVKAVLALAENRPPVLKALRTLAEFDPAGEVLTFALAVGIALQVDAGRLEPDGMIQRLTRVQYAHQEVYPQGDSDAHTETRFQAPGERFVPAS